MGIEDIQISEELETNAPSIKYRGDEGPRSPQQEQQMMMAQLEEAYSQYVDEMIEMEMEPMSLQQFIEQAMAEGQMAGGNPLPQDPTKPVNPFQPKPTGPVLPDRQMAAFGGIMGLDGRRQYGFGSKLKDRFRKLIPNEVAAIAETAAPFVAPLNPALAAAMSGIGSFDRTGRIGSSIKSGLTNYAMGQLARGVGGGMDNLQASPFRKGVSFGERFQGFGDASKMGSEFGKYFSSPIQESGGIGKMFKENFTDRLSTSGGSMAEGVDEKTLQKIADSAADKNLSPEKLLSKKANEAFIKNTQASNLSLLDKAKDYVMNNKLASFLLAKEGLDLFGGPEETVSEIMDRGEGLDLEGIRAEVLEAYKDPSGKKLKDLVTKYPYIHQDADVVNVAQGGRIGYGLGSLVTESGVAQPVSASMSAGDAPVMSSSGMGGMFSKLINNNPQIFKNVSGQNNSSSSVMPSGGMGGMFSKFFSNPRMYNQYLRNQEDFIDENFNDIDDREEGFMGSRISRAEGGLMDLGGMEKDYRAEGGFVPIGREEKADDVPARLSVNEFVFTADAVRNAGGGDIDRGCRS